MVVELTSRDFKNRKDFDEYRRERNALSGEINEFKKGRDIFEADKIRLDEAKLRLA